MQVNIANKDLVKLYQTGKSNKYKLPTKIVDKFMACIEKIEAAATIHDFWNNPSLNFEKLKGLKDAYSMRLDLKYRLEMQIDWEDEKMIVGIVSITELSTHYQ